MVVIDSYSEINQDVYWNIRDVHPSGSDCSAIAQSITGDGKSLTLVKFYLMKWGSPVGNLVAVLYAHSGTFGTSSVPTGAALSTSGPVAMAALTGSYVLYTFTFGTPYTLASGTKYVISLEAQSADTLDGSNYIRVGYDGSSPSHAGNLVRYNAGSWSAIGGDDTCFYAEDGIVSSGGTEKSIFDGLMLDG